MVKIEKINPKLLSAIKFAERYFHEAKIYRKQNGEYEVEPAHAINIPKSWKLLLHTQEDKIVSANKKYFKKHPRG